MNEHFEQWAIVELLGHRVRPGFAQEVEMFGAKMLKVTIFAMGQQVEEFYGAGAIYAIRPCTEAQARERATSVYEFRSMAAIEGPSVKDADFEQNDQEMPF